MDIDEIENIVWDCIKDLPKEFSMEIENVQFVVELWPTLEEMQKIRAHPGTLLFGLYQGIPKTQRRSNYSSLPDKITIYAGPILYVSKSLDEVREKIKSTVLHEIGHFFGMSEERIRKAEKDSKII